MADDWNYLAKLSRASFGGIEFPYSKASIKGSYRLGVHEYRNRAGAELEKHKRKLYTVTFDCIADVNVSKAVLPGGIQGWPGWFPEGLQTLAECGERGDTLDLTYPGVGTFPAILEDWTRTLAPSESLSGEIVQLAFREDSTTDLLLEGKAQEQAKASVDEQVAKVAAYAEEAELGPSDLDAIRGVIDSVIGFRDQVSFLADVVEAKIESVCQLIRELDKTLKALQDPSNWQLSLALMDLVSALQDLSETVGQPDIRMKTVTLTQSVQQLSIELYKSTAQVPDLLALNPAIEDPSRIPAGTRISYIA